MKAPEGINVRDFRLVKSVPSCTQIFAWFGADVIESGGLGVEYAAGAQNQTMYR